MKIQKYNDKTWEILKEINGKVSFNNKKDIVWKRQKEDFGGFEYEKGEELALAELEKLEAIEIYTDLASRDIIESYANSIQIYNFSFNDREYRNKRNLYIKINPEIFYKVYREYESFMEDNKKDDRKRKEIIIDFQKGIYEKDNIKKIYKISGKRFKIVEQLSKERKTNTPLKELIANTGQSDVIIIQAIKSINKIFRKKLNLKEDLIVNLKTGGGYRLNDEDFIIKKNKTFT